MPNLQFCYSTNEFRNQSECQSNTECVPTYGFHHSISLTSNVSYFEVSTSPRHMFNTMQYKEYMHTCSMIGRGGLSVCYNIQCVCICRVCEWVCEHAWVCAYECIYVHVRACWCMYAWECVCLCVVHDYYVYVCGSSWLLRDMHVSCVECSTRCV